MIKQAIVIVALSLVFAAARPFFPHGIAWNGKWPTSSTSAEDAYKMMAKADDPAFVSLQEVIEIQEKKSATLLDARSSAEYKAGRIPGARCIPFYELEQYQASALEGLTAESPMVIYCEGIGCELSFFLGRDLKAAGYTDIRIFYGGYPEWSQAGLPIEKDKS